MKVNDGLHVFPWNSMAANNCNTYLLEGDARILIDPGHVRLFPHVESGLREAGLNIADIDLVICTHAHPDHIEAVRLFKDTEALFALHEGDWQLLGEMGRSLGTFFDTGGYTPNFFLTSGDLTVKDLQLQVIHTPGHSPGSVSLYWPRHKALFTGDVLFKDGLGRTDLPGGNGDTLKKSIGELAFFDVEWFFPGHGDFIQGGRKVRNNFERVEEFWFAYI